MAYIEFDGNGAELRRVTAGDLGQSWTAIHSAVKLTNGNWFLGASYQGDFYEIDADNNIVWQLTAADIPEIGFTYAAGCQILPNGHIVVAGYNSTFPIFEITREKEVVWKMQNGDMGSPTHVMILDMVGDPANGDIIR
jgi:hypothetical protein